MGLDLVDICRQIDGIGASVRQAGESRRAQLETARRLVVETDDARWRELSQDRLSGRALPEPQGPLTTCSPALASPPSFSVVGVDGSQLIGDRHAHITCHVINVGTASLRYGPESYADLSSSPRLAYREEDRYICDPAHPEARVPIQGAVLHACRTVKEIERLAEIAEGFQVGQPGLLLLDGSLVFWGLVKERFPNFVRDRLLKDYEDNLDRVWQANQAGRTIPVAGYTSRPDSTGVVELLRRELCREPECRNACSGVAYGRRPCDQLNGILDRDVFGLLLPGLGDRSALFVGALTLSGQADNRRNLDDCHQPLFFYLNTGAEIARVEVPAWVGADPDRLRLVHALVADQVRRGGGYPVALAEAHEQAVITGRDREQFWYLVEVALQANGVAAEPSAKGWSKRWRAI